MLPGRGQLVRCRRHQRARRPRRGARRSARQRRAVRPAGAAVVGPNHRGAAGVAFGPGRRIVRSRRGRTCPTSPTPSPRRREDKVRMAAVVHDQRARGARCCRPPSTTTSSSANPSMSAEKAQSSRPGRFPVPRSGRAARRDGARALRLRAGVRRALRRARPGSATSSADRPARGDLRRGRSAIWSAPTAPSPRCSPWSTRWPS